MDKKLGTKAVRNYWRKVIRRAFNSAWSEVGMSAIIIGLALVIIVTASTSLLAALGVPIPIPILSFQVDKVQAGVEDFIISGGVLIVLFVLMIYQTPAEMNQANENILKEKENDLQKLKDQYESLPLQNPLVITPFNDIELKKRVGIRIDNPTTQRISNIKVDLVELIWINEKNEQSPVAKDSISEANRSFKSGQGFEDSFSIAPLGHAFMYLAEERDGLIVFLLEEAAPNNFLYWEWKEEERHIEATRKLHPSYEGRTEYIFISIIDLVVNGEIEGHPLTVKPFKDWLRFGKTMMDRFMKGKLSIFSIDICIGLDNLIKKGFIIINEKEYDELKKNLSS